MNAPWRRTPAPQPQSRGRKAKVGGAILGAVMAAGSAYLASRKRKQNRAYTPESNLYTDK